MRQLRSQTGFSIVEVLVSILIVSLGILALAGLMVRSASLAKAAEFRGTASLLAADMADRIRANEQGNYESMPTTFATEPPATPNPACTPEKPCPEANQMAAKDLADWQTELLDNLPSGTGWVEYDPGTARGEIYVMWRDPSSEDRARNMIGSENCPEGMDENAACIYFRVGR